MEESFQVRLRAYDKTELTVRVTPLPDRRYRFEETPFLAMAPEPLHCGDVVEAELRGDGTHEITRIVERAPLRHYSWVLARQFYESEGYRTFVAGVTAAGGSWERLFGGVFMVHIPQGSSFDPDAELGKWTSADLPA